MTAWWACASSWRRVSRRWRKVLEAIIRTVTLKSDSCSHLRFPGIGSMVAEKVDEDNLNSDTNSDKKKIVYIVAAFLLPLPLLAFIFCLSAIYIFRETGLYEAALVTHCHVDNFALSVSEAISNPDSSRFIWQLAIVLHTPSRVFFTKQLKTFYFNALLQTKNRINVQFWISWIYATSMVSHLEWIALFGLSFLTSHGVFSLHETCVGIFLVSFIVHMAMACNCERLCSSSNVVGRYVVVRRIVASVSFVSVLMTAYFYHRHNSLCEPYVYSMFCLSEYLSIVLNMNFHLIAPNMIWRANNSKTDINQNWTQKNNYGILKI